MRVGLSILLLLSTLSLALPLALSLTACSARAHSADYFEAHPGEAQTVLARCRSGQVRGEACETALAGAKAAADQARLKLFRKGF
jgi:hypothetical protein